MEKVVVLGGYAESLLNFRGHLIRALVEKGAQVLACAPNAPPRVVEGLHAIGAEYRHVPLRRAAMNPFSDLRALSTLRRLFRRERPELALSYTIKPVIYGSLAAAWAGVPRIYSMITGAGYALSGGGIRGRAAGFAARGLYRRALRRNRAVFFQNPDDLELFDHLGLAPRDRAVLINGSGVDLSRFCPAPYPENPTFLCVARLIWEKGIREYVEACAAVRARHPQVRCLLVGWIDGENPACVSEGELERWQREGAVEFLGRLDDVVPALASCSVFVLPSYYREGIPRTLLEALAMARPVITTDHPGCREAVDDGTNGFLVPVRDPAAVARAMERFVDEPALIPRMGGRGRLLAEERFDVDKVNQVILQTMGVGNGAEAPR